MSHTIHPATSIGPVHLTVSDLERSLAFYTERLGFQVRHREPGSAWLGAGGADLLVLEERPGAVRTRGTTGLYHFAILVPSRLDLARSLARLVETHTRLSGASDHLVSEALYLSDPDGTGIEIYHDRPREEWRYERGEVRMATLPLDLDGLLALSEVAREPRAQGLAPETRMGHVHLQVADLAAAERFYVGALGFERTARYGPEALFVSAGGYHHHIGLNTWAGAGAPPPPPGAAGLRHFTVTVPDDEELERVLARARAEGIGIDSPGPDAILRDPSGNRVLITSAARLPKN